MKFSPKFLRKTVQKYNSETRVVDDMLLSKTLEPGTLEHRACLFSYKGKHYQTAYKKGVNERPFEFDEDKIECPEVAILPV